MQTFIHMPAQRQRHSPTTIDLVVLRALRSALAADWSRATAEEAAADACATAEGNIGLLRLAKVRLLRRFPVHHTEVGDRAMAALNLAIVLAAHQGRSTHTAA